MYRWRSGDHRTFRTSGQLNQGSPDADQEAGLPPGRRQLAAFAVALAVAMSVLDGVMLNVALPSIAKDLAVTPASAIWVINAYQFANAIVLVPLGKIADSVGHSKVYLACMALFTAASIGCAASSTLLSLSLWRVAQGCGGAGVVGVTNAMLRLIYPPSMLARGIGLNSLIVALSLASGPILASLIVELIDWQWLFLVNAPIGLVLLVIGWRALPIREGLRDRFDWCSAVMSILTFGSVILAIDAGAHAQGYWTSLWLGLMGVTIGSALVRRQLGQSRPMLPLDLLRNRMFAMSVATMFGAAMAQIMAYVSLPFLFQHDLGRSQIETGMLFLPWPIALAVAAMISGRWGTQWRPAITCSIGLGIFAIGLLSLAALQPGASNIDIIWRMALCGIGYGSFQPSSSRAMITSAPRERAGSASVMGATGRVLGQAVGAALIAALFRTFPATGSTIALLAAVGITLAAAMFSAIRGQPTATSSMP